LLGIYLEKYVRLVRYKVTVFMCANFGYATRLR
jgi:hypothetical protein